MVETRRLTVELPVDLLDTIEADVNSGRYPSLSAVLVDAVEALHGIHEVPSDDWLRANVLPVLDECERDPSRLIPAEDILARLEQRHSREMKARERDA